MSDYIPTTEEVRNWWTNGDVGLLGQEFDRWLDEVKAQAWEEGWMRCVSMSEDSELSANPYRQGEK